MQRLICIVWLLLSSLLVFGVEEEANTNKSSSHIENVECASCPYSSGEPTNDSAPKTIGLAAIIGLAFFYLYSIKKRRLFLVIGGVLVLALISSIFIQSEKRVPVSCIAPVDSTKEDEFNNIGSEFEPINNEGITQNSEINEFKDAEDEFKDAEDEFSDSVDEFTTINDKFPESDGDEFTPLSIEKISPSNQNKSFSSKDKRTLLELAVIFFFVVVVGLFINNVAFQKFRPLFLVSMLVWLGFVRGGCPCMISSFQNLFLKVLGNDINWTSYLWFLGLIPLTYFLGRVWCGWLCHLGALQEFLFSATKFSFLKKEKHQKVIKIIQISVLVTLIVQLIVTKSNLFIHYDPFKVAFNLFSTSTTGYVLLVILLASSALVYRPFCRGFCPVGLVLGWVSLLPWARKITQKDTCVDCIKCSKECKSGALIYENKLSKVNGADCIACGDCLDSCTKHALIFTKNK